MGYGGPLQPRLAPLMVPRVNACARQISARTRKVWMGVEFYFIIALMVVALAGAALELLNSTGFRSD